MIKVEITIKDKKKEVSRYQEYMKRMKRKQGERQK